MSNNSFDEIRENVLQTAQEHYDKNNPEYTAFIAGAGYILSQHDITKPTVTMNPGAYKQGETVSGEIRQYTEKTEDEVAEWVVEKSEHQIGVAIIGSTLHFDDQKAEYGDYIEYSVLSGFTVHSGNSPKD